MDPEDAVKILMAEHPQEYIEEYKQLNSKSFNSEEATKVKEIFNELRVLQKRIYPSLENILLREDYIMHDCVLCPGRSNSSP